MKNFYKRNLRKMIALLAIAACLTGCTGVSHEPQNQTAMDTTAQEEPLLSKNSYQEQPVSMEPTRIVESVNENLRIDAAVLGSPANGKAGIYTGAPKIFTKGEIEAFVEHCGGSITSVKESDDGDMMYYNGTCSNGYRFAYMRGLEGVNHHPYAEFNYSNPERSRIYYEYPIYYSEYHYLTNSQNMVGNMFAESKDFSFATEAEAEAAVREALNILGLPELFLLRTLYIDHSTMGKVGQILATDERFAPITGAKENNGYTLRDDWSEDDDAYMFSFGISVSGTPMSYLFDDCAVTATYCGSEVIVWYTKYGITYMTVNTPWTLGAEESAPESIVSAQTAMEAVKEKYGYDLALQDKRVEEIRLLYLYIQDRDRWLLRPAWVARISYGSAYSDDHYYTSMYIDAFTGKEF